MITTAFAKDKKIHQWTTKAEARLALAGVVNVYAVVVLRLCFRKNCHCHCHVNDLAIDIVLSFWHIILIP